MEADLLAVILAAVFVGAGYTKLVPRTGRRSLDDIVVEMTGRRSKVRVTLVIGVLELLVGLALLVPSTRDEAFGAAAIFIVMASTTYPLRVYNGGSTSCACFGRKRVRRPIGAFGEEDLDVHAVLTDVAEPAIPAARNALLMGVSALGLTNDSARILVGVTVVLLLFVIAGVLELGRTRRGAERTHLSIYEDLRPHAARTVPSYWHLGVSTGYLASLRPVES